MQLLMPRQKNDDVAEEAFERFAIMTIDGGMSDEKALAYIVKTYGFYAASKVQTVLSKNGG